MVAPIDLPTMHRLLRHEAEVHAVPGRTLRDLGDSLLLHDPVEREPFWNRLEAVDWPSDPTAFDQRLAEVAVLFATIGRQPHVWASPPHDRPVDLVARLRANGFEDVGPGYLMLTRSAEPARAALERPIPAGIELQRLNRMSVPAATAAADDIAGVLLGAFGVDEERRPGVLAETLASLADPRFTHYLVRLDGVPSAVARRATFDGLSYLSSIGTVEAARGRGLGRLVTATAMVDAAEAGSDYIHLGVFADNTEAMALYQKLGFDFHGDPAPDMMLIG
jgi:ribosomal protein S18 acetylase RimI-like enzyme